MTMMLTYSAEEDERPISRWAVWACGVGWLTGPLLWATQELMGGFREAYPGVMEDWYYPLALSPVLLSFLVAAAAMLRVCIGIRRVSGKWVIVGGMAITSIWVGLLLFYWWAQGV